MDQAFSCMITVVHAKSSKMRKKLQFPLDRLYDSMVQLIQLNDSYAVEEIEHAFWIQGRPQLPLPAIKSHEISFWAAVYFRPPDRLADLRLAVEHQPGASLFQLGHSGD